MKSSKRAILVVGALAALLPFWTPSVGAAVVTTTVATASAGTPFDRAIDLMVQKRAATEKLSATDARVLREQLQMQFMSLSSADQQKVLSAAQNLNSEEAVDAAIKSLSSTVQSAARQIVADMAAADAAKAGSVIGPQIKPKLGGFGPDLVFVATAGPCRVGDTRFGIFAGWPGPVLAFEARQFYVYSTVSGFSWALNQGGTGSAGSGNCVGTVYGGVAPVAVVATVSVTNTSSGGALRAWDGTTALTTGAAATWVAFGTQANTTVVPIDRAGPIYPGSGPFKKDIGVFNNSFTPIDVVVDVVGYFIENTATPLECQRILDTDFSLGAFSSLLRTAPACPAGFTAMTGMPATNVFGVYTGSFFENQCRINNNTGATVNFLRCDAMCCRIPGR